jgi:hypothetical protein
VQTNDKLSSSTDNRPVFNSRFVVVLFLVVRTTVDIDLARKARLVLIRNSFDRSIVDETIRISDLFSHIERFAFNVFVCASMMICALKTDEQTYQAKINVNRGETTTTTTTTSGFISFDEQCSDNTIMMRN